MTYDLPWYTIILTFIVWLQVDTEHPENGSGKLGLNRLKPPHIQHTLIYQLVQSSSNLKGVLHPRLVFGLFLHFSQKLQHIGNK